MNAFKKRYYHWRADVHLLSYPKCGRTWLRLMLSTLLHEHFGLRITNLHQIHKLANRRRGIPCVYFTHDWRGTSGNVETMFLEMSKARFSGHKVMMLVRDPRDVVVSNFFQKRDREKTFSGDIHQFVRDPVRGIEGIVDYYTLWARERSRTSEFSVIRYEDMRKDAVGEMQRTLAYCGVSDIASSHISDVVDRFSFERMQRLEREGALPGKSTTPGDAGNPDSYKARAGKVGGHKDYLNDADLGYIEDVIRTRLDPWFASYRLGDRG